jgi:hypothetical protein
MLSLAARKKKDRVASSVQPRLIGMAPNFPAGAGAKVFWFFSSEKNILPDGH